jgi:hypothetical protein
MAGSTEFDKVAKARGLEYRPTDSDDSISLELLNASLDSAISSAKERKLGEKAVAGLRHLRDKGSISEKINFVHGDGSYLIVFDPSQRGELRCHIVLDGAIYYEVAIVLNNGIIITYKRIKVISHLECQLYPV